jgi:hypothetical protein
LAPAALTADGGVRAPGEKHSFLRHYLIKDHQQGRIKFSETFSPSLLIALLPYFFNQIIPFFASL